MGDTLALHWQDKIESAHSRLDSFYAWAAQLQKEFRDLQSRIGFIEAQTEISACAGEQLKNWKESKVSPLAEEEERALIERLTRITSSLNLKQTTSPSPLQAESGGTEQASQEGGSSAH